MNSTLKKKLLLCDCLGTQSVDGDTIEKTLGISCSPTCSSLCSDQADLAEKAIAAGNVVIACQQERNFFEEMAVDLQAELPEFVDIRDRAGWSTDEKSTSPKMTALIADALTETPALQAMDVESSGTCLIIGSSEAAFAAANQLCETLAVTVLLAPGEDIGAGIDRRFDIVFGKLSSATGALGNFEVEINKFQARIPGGRGAPEFTEPRNGAKSACDIIFDLRGGDPLFSAHEKREGYLRADPKRADAHLAAVLEAAQLVGTFEKPLYVRLDETLCAHSRAAKTGCTRCMDLCPTGAIVPAGDQVSVDPMICAGCGMCSAACPSGAISYDAPSPAHLFKRIETLASTWRKLSKSAPRLLVHDAKFGVEIIQLSARYGKGLPADVIPMEVPALAAFGHAEILAALGTGFADVTVLLAPTTEHGGVAFQVELANAIADSEIACRLIEPSDPDIFDEMMREKEGEIQVEKPVLPLGTRRQVTRLAAKALNEKDAVIELPKTAPYGAVKVNTETCTLCLSCVSLCPSGALTENPDLPQLRFQEDACLQCGICTNICPESAMSLEPRLNLSDQALAQTVLHEEEPFACIECGALFGVRSTVMRVTEQLAGKHAMFANEDAMKMIQMCDNCRINANYHSQNNPLSGGERPRVRTTADYQQSKRRDH